MSKREVIAYAITHAPPGVKGGPYEGVALEPFPRERLKEAWRTPAGTLERAKSVLVGVRCRVPHARVIRIVRARPSEASAVEVLRSFIAWVDCNDGEEEAPLRPIEEAARRVLAASGPDPMPVVRAAMRYWNYGPDGRLGPAWVGFREACEAYRKAGGK